jgi:hypothetical protein
LSGEPFSKLIRKIWRPILPKPLMATLGRIPEDFDLNIFVFVNCFDFSINMFDVGIKKLCNKLMRRQDFFDLVELPLL